MEEILPIVESYVFVEHSNKPVITITGRPVVTGSHEDFKAGIDILRDISIHVDFNVPPADVDDSVDSTSTETEEVNDNFTRELKKARLEYKLAKTTLIREFAVYTFNDVEGVKKFLVTHCFHAYKTILYI